MGISRLQLFRRFQAVPLIDTILERQYTADAQGNDTHGPDKDPWHTAFHASSFPLDEHTSCGRKAVYGLANFAKPDDGISTQGVAIMEAGVDIELRQVERFHRAGVLLSEPPGQPQTSSTFPEAWLVGHSDAVILPPGWKSPHPVEIKGKDSDVVDAMRAGQKGWDAPHRAQLMCYIFLSRQYDWHGPNGELLEPATDGTLLYVARNRPRKVAEFYFEYDEQLVKAALARLWDWKEAFKADVLPERPKEWRWTFEPCKWCGYKKKCKEDVKAGVDKISMSALVEVTKAIDSGWDLDKVRNRVASRWEKAE